MFYKQQFDWLFKLFLKILRHTATLFLKNWATYSVKWGILSNIKLDKVKYRQQMGNHFAFITRFLFYFSKRVNLSLDGIFVNNPIKEKY